MAHPISSTGQAMEDVLDQYAEPYELQMPVVWFEETAIQVLAESRTPLPAGPGRPRRQGYEHESAGTRDLFLA